MHKPESSARKELREILASAEVIIFANHSLDADDITVFEKTLEKCSKLRDLTLRDLTLNKDVDSRLLFQVLQNSPQLEHFSLGGISINGGNVNALVLALQKFSALKTLFISIYEISLIRVIFLVLPLTLRKIDFYSRSIDTVDLSSFITVLPRYTQLTHLILRNCKVEDPGVAALLAVLPQCHALEELYCTYNSISHYQKTLSIPIFDTGHPLRISLVDCEAGPLSIAALSQVLLRCNHLQELVLNKIPIWKADVEVLAKALPHCQNLRTLSISSCGIGDDWAIALATVLARSSVTEFFLKKNVIRDEGVIALSGVFNGYESTSSKVRTLSIHVSDNVYMTADSAPSIVANLISVPLGCKLDFKLWDDNSRDDVNRKLYSPMVVACLQRKCDPPEALKGYCGKVCSLILANAQYSDSEITKCLTKDLETLVLFHTHISDSGVEILTDMITGSITALTIIGGSISGVAMARLITRCSDDLDYLTINDCEIDLDGSIALSIALSKCRVLVDINLSHNMIEPSGFSLLMGGLQKCLRLRTLNLAHIPLGNNSTGQLIKNVFAVVKLRHLNSLYLDDTNMNDADIELLSSLLPKCHVTHIYLRHNHMSNNGAMALAKKLPQFCQWNELHLEYNDISDDGLLALAKNLPYGESSGKHQRVFLSQNRISREGAALARIAVTPTGIKSLFDDPVTLLGLEDQRTIFTTLPVPLTESRSVITTINYSLESDATPKEQPVMPAKVVATQVQLFCPSLKPILLPTPPTVSLVVQEPSSVLHLKVLLSSLPSYSELKVLNLVNEDLDNEACLYLAEILSQYTVLQELNLSKNPKISDRGIAEIIDALPKCPALQLVALGTALSSYGDEVSIAKQTKEGCPLIRLSLIDSGISSLSVAALLRVLPQCIYLQSLIIQHVISTGRKNIITDAEMLLLLTALPHQSLKTLTLDGLSISDESVFALVRVLVRHDQLTRLQLNDNLISDKGVAALIAAANTDEAFKNCKYGCKFINIMHNPLITTMHLPMIFDNLLLTNHLICLRLWNSWEATDHKLYEAILAALIKRPIKEMLRLKDSFSFGRATTRLLNNQEIHDEHIANLIALGGIHSYLKIVNLADNHITSVGAEKLATKFLMGCLLTVLNMSGNIIGGAAIDALIVTCSNTVKELVFSHCGLNGQDIKKFVTTLSNCSELSTLTLSNNPLSAEGISELTIALQHCSKLTKLDLTNTALGYEGIQKLALMLPKLTGLQELHLDNNAVLKDIEVLAPTLSQCPQLQILYLRHNQLDDTSVDELVKILPKCAKLIELHLEHNEISDTGALTLHRCITKRLHSIYLQQNRLSVTKEAFDGW